MTACHGGSGALRQTDQPRIAVLGMPNTGKSTLFSQLTGTQAHIGNWPGLTVDLPPGVAAASPDSLSGRLGDLLQPLLAPIGITPRRTVALVFGFIAKEIVLGGQAVIYGQSEAHGALGAAPAGEITRVQAVSFMLFTLLYTPCLSTVAVIRSESKWPGFTLFSVGWSLLLAWLVSFAFVQAAGLLGWR